MTPYQFAAKVFFVTGLLYPPLSYVSGFAALRSLDIYTHGSYFVVMHLPLLLLSALLFWVYGVFYYLGVRIFALPLSSALAMLYLIVTMLALLSFESMGLIGPRSQSPIVAPSLHSFLVQHMSPSVTGHLFLLSARLFVLIVVLAIITKRRQAAS